MCFTQISAKKGIKKFGERTLNAIITEYEQLEDFSVFTPLDLKYMNKEDHKNGLYDIDLIKEKRTGKLKGRKVVDGRKQRPLYDKYDISSPALSQDDFLGTLVIDRHKNRYVGITDIVGAFIKADQNDLVVVKF